MDTDQKRPWLAAVLALVSPGLGHVYLREWFRALLWFGLVVSTTSLLVPESALSATVPSAMTVDAVVDAFVAASEAVRFRTQLALFGITTLSMADAYWMATAGNRRAAADAGTVCPSCGKELDDDLSFCHWCTTELPEAPEATPADPKSEPSES